MSNNQIILGIDCSTFAIAIATMDPNRAFTTFLLSSTDKNWNNRYFDLYLQFDKFLQKKYIFINTHKKKIKAIFIEEIPFVHNRQNFSKLTKVVGMCELVCFQYSLPYFLVNNKSWKLSVIGDGSASKFAIKEFSREFFGDTIETLSQDEVDALCISYHGLLSLNSSS